MGGLGSGCWERDDCDKKISVEECYIIDVNEIARDDKLRVGAVGVYTWSNQFDEHLLRVDFSTVPSGYMKRALLLMYRWEDWRGEDSEDVSLPILLQTTYPNYGGVRWWFTCPLIVEGKPCNRRVGKLYLPPGERYFGCRHCHNLAYRREPNPLEHADRVLEIHRRRMERAKARHGW